MDELLDEEEEKGDDLSKSGLPSVLTITQNPGTKTDFPMRILRN